MDLGWDYRFCEAEVKMKLMKKQKIHGWGQLEYRNEEELFEKMLTWIVTA